MLLILVLILILLLINIIIFLIIILRLITILTIKIIIIMIISTSYNQKKPNCVRVSNNGSFVLVRNISNGKIHLSLVVSADREDETIHKRVLN